MSLPIRSSRVLLATLLGALLADSSRAQISTPVAQTTARQETGSSVVYDPSQVISAGNYHVLHNGVDTIVTGIGSGVTSTPGVDGVGTWIPGEQLRGNHKTSMGNFGYRQVGFRETVVVTGAGPLEINFPYIGWFEVDGGNAHTPVVFTNVNDPNCSTVGTFGPIAMPYGAPPSQANFIATTTPAPSSQSLLVPNEDLLAGPNTITPIAELFDLVIPITPADSGFVWEVQIEWLTPVESMTDIDGWYHWATSSPNGDQHFAMSDDELNLWQSHTVASAFGLSGALALPARMEYGLMMLSGDPVTAAALAPVGRRQNGPYYSTAVVGPNTGFDLGRGSEMLSISGIQGVTASGTDPLGNQDPAGVGLGHIPSIGFVTFDNTDYDGDGDLVGTPPTGSQRLMWVDIDWDLTFGLAPELALPVVTFLGCVAVPLRFPASGGPYPAPLTTSLFPFFTHTAAPVAWPDPGGFGGTSGDFGIPMVAGSTVHLPVGALGPLCIGLPIAMSYGSSGLTPSGTALTWDPSIARVSGTRQLFLVD